MNIVGTLTVRQMKKNKRRTLVTILGAVIAAAMLTAIATLTLSFTDLMQRQEIFNSGDWHAKFENVSAGQIAALKADKGIISISENEQVGYSALAAPTNKRRPYIYVEGADSGKIAEYGISMLSGRLPENDSELILSQSIYNSGAPKYKAGDRITLDVGQREVIGKSGEVVHRDDDQNTRYMNTNSGSYTERLYGQKKREYTVVGIFAQPNAERSNTAGYLTLTGLGAEQKGPTTASVKFEKLDRGIYDKIESLENELGISGKQVTLNKGLLRWHGIIASDGMTNTLYTFMGILLAIIMVGGISLIYNAFAISVSERTRYLGMLASVGATKKQKRGSVLLEGLIIGAISIPIGVVSGLLGLFVTYKFINPLLLKSDVISKGIEGFRVVISPASIVAAVLLSGLAIFISTLIPAISASRVSAIDAVRQTKEVKIKRSEVKTSRLTQRIFGFEGAMGMKNLKRSKGRYHATVFSLVVSVVLFLSVSAFTMYMSKTVEMSSEDVDYDLILRVHSGSENTDFDAVLQELSEYNDMPFVTDRSEYFSLLRETKLKDLQKPDYFEKLGGSSSSMSARIVGLSDEKLTQLCRDTGVSKSVLLDTEKPACIVYNRVKYRTEQGNKIVEDKAIVATQNDTLEIGHIDDEGVLSAQKPITLAGFADKAPMGFASERNLGTLVLFTSAKTAKSYYKSVNDNFEAAIAFTSSNADETEKAITTRLESSNLNRIAYLFNQAGEGQKTVNMLAMLNIFTYGFVILIALICTANIFNTISSGVLLRRREFAMLRSAGMTKKGFKKMLSCECLFYGLKALLWGFPISFGIMLLLHKVLSNSFVSEFTLPFAAILIATLGVFAIVAVTIFYAFRKTASNSIVEALTEENI